MRLVPGGDRRLLLVCDHASNAVPAGIDLGIPDDAFGDHVAYDIGAAAVSETVAAALDAPAWLATASRLVVDCNRPLDHSIPERSDGLIIRGNVGLTAAELEFRHELHARFHDGLSAIIAANAPQLLVSMHSFTPALATAPAPRPWPIAILWNHDERAAGLGLEALAAEGDLGGPVGANEPYSGKVLNYTMNRHAEANGIPYLGFEIRQDLIADEQGALVWSAIVARTVSTVLARLGG